MSRTLPIEYWRAICDTPEEAEARYNLHRARVQPDGVEEV